MRFVQLRRREFLALLAGTAFGWPIPAHAQQNSLPIVGFLNPRSQSKGEAVANAFRQGLRDAGYEEGRNVAVEYRWADGQIDRLPALAADLVVRRVAVIVAGGGTWVAAKGATSSIPIVFTSGLDPVRTGMVKSINRPEANLTGATFYSGGALFEKQIDLLRAFVPNVKTVALMVHVGLAEVETQLQDAENAARKNGLSLRVVRVADVPDLGPAFDSIDADGMLFTVDPFFDSRPAEIVAGLGAATYPHYLLSSRVRRSGWACKLWREHPRYLSASGTLRRSHSWRRQTWGSTGAATNPIRTSYQRQDCTNIGSVDPTDLARHRRRGHRVIHYIPAR
jgi:putative ABC transport system substrate-binding protein